MGNAEATAKATSKASDICTKAKAKHAKNKMNMPMPMVCYGLPVVPQSFHMIFYHFPMVSYNCHMFFSMVCLWFAYDCLALPHEFHMVCLWFPYGLPMVVL